MLHRMAFWDCKQYKCTCSSSRTQYILILSTFIVLSSQRGFRAWILHVSWAIFISCMTCKPAWYGSDSVEYYHSDLLPCNHAYTMWRQLLSTMWSLMTVKVTWPALLVQVLSCLSMPVCFLCIPSVSLACIVWAFNVLSISSVHSHA